MRITYAITTTIEGTLDEVITTPAPTHPTLEQVLATLDGLAFIVESVAHLQGREGLLKLTDTARDLSNRLRTAP